MEVRRPKISPEELLPFSRKSLCSQAPPIPLPCPPYRISPLCKQSNRSMMKQMSHMNHLSRIIKQSSSPCPWTKTLPSPWLQHLVTLNPQVPHTYHKTMLVPLGHLHHQATAKLSTLHKGHPLASGKPFPRANIGTRKIDVSSKADKQHLMLLLSSKHQLEFPLHPVHQPMDSSGLSCHYPKIYQCHDQPAENLPNFNQKPLIPPFPNYQTTEDPPCEDHKTKAEAIPSTFPDSQDPTTPATMSSEHQEETSLKSRQSFIHLKHVIIIPSCDNQYYSWAAAFESPSEVQHSKTSHHNLCSVSQETTLPDFHQVSYPPDCYHQSETAPDPNTQASFPPDYIKLSGGPEHHFTPTPNTLSNHENQDRSISDSTDYQQNHTPPISLSDQETAQPRPSCRTRFSPGPRHQTLDSNHQDQVQNGLQQQTQTVLKRQGPWGFSYIKPFIIKRGSVPAKIVHDVINSIPQEKIKKDMSKRIALWKTGQSPTHCPDQSFFSNYIVCLVCGSWIPYGCPHTKKTKYPCVTQLLAIPILLPGSKQKLNVKFVFQVPQTTACNIFGLPYTHYCLQRPLHHPSGFPTSSQTDPVLSEPAKKKWLHFILGKNYQPREKARIRSRQSRMKKMPRKRQRSARRGSSELKQREN
ncbi:uncharacterized protein [Notamacropus eugenii]|uniref:uncharacterized protein n=1 Tax=Notamacropus eugenii TaxID=9315 RepID=UPI003B683412